MDAKQRYEMWLGSDQVDDVTKQELVNIKDNEAEIEDRFYTNLEFGTGGLGSGNEPHEHLHGSHGNTGNC